MLKMKFIKSLMKRIVWPYTPLFVTMFFVIWWIFMHFNLFETNIDNLRYLFSTIIQSNAAIIALVVTLSLIAVQLSSTTYSTRTIEIFKKMPDAWILLSWYGISICYDLFLLYGLNTEKRPLPFLTFISLWLAASAFVALFPFILAVMRILVPEAIIRQLAEDISSPLKTNAFQAIIDIVHLAFARHDYETVRKGISAMTEKAIIVIKKYNSEVNNFSARYCRHMEEIGGFFAIRDQYLTKLVINHLTMFGETMLEKGIIEEHLIHALGYIGRTAANNGFKEATKCAAESIGTLGKSIPYEKYAGGPFQDGYFHTEKCTYIISVLEDVGMAATKQWGVFGVYWVKELGDIGVVLAKKKLLWGAHTAAAALNRLGIAALLEKGYSEKYVSTLLQVSVINPLSEIGKIAHGSKGMKKAFERAAFALWDIGITAEVMNFGDLAKGAAKALAELATLEKEAVEGALAAFAEREKLTKESPVLLLHGLHNFINLYEKHLKR